MLSFLHIESLSRSEEDQDPVDRVTRRRHDVGLLADGQRADLALQSEHAGRVDRAGAQHQPVVRHPPGERSELADRLFHREDGIGADDQVHAALGRHLHRVAVLRRHQFRLGEVACRDPAGGAALEDPVEDVQRGHVVGALLRHQPGRLRLHHRAVLDRVEACFHHGADARVTVHVGGDLLPVAMGLFGEGPELLGGVGGDLGVVVLRHDASKCHHNS